MNTQTEALKLALDFLMTRRMGAESVIDALQEALAQPEQELTEKEKISRGMTTEFVAMRALAQQEPFAWADARDLSADTAFRWCETGKYKTPLYIKE